MHSTHDAFGLWQTENEIRNADSHEVQERIIVRKLTLGKQSIMIFYKNLQIWTVP